MWRMGLLFGLGLGLAGACLAAGEAAAGLRTVTLRNGLKIAYRETGREGGKPVVFLHGYSLSSACWAKVQRRLPEGYRTLALDLPGFGDSDKPECGYGYSELADTVAQFLDALHIDQALVVGHSFGGNVAQHLAVERPGRLSGLVISNATACNLPPRGVGEAVRQRMAAYGDREANRAVFRQSMARYFDVANLGPGDLEAFVEIGLQAGNAALRQTLETLYATPAIPSGRFAAIGVPTLIVVAAHDPFGSFDQAVAMSDAISGSRVAVVPRSGHSPMWEKPEEYAALLAAFLQGQP